MTTASSYYRRASMPPSSLSNFRQHLTPTPYFHTRFSSNLQDYQQIGRIFNRNSSIRPSTTLLCNSRDTSTDRSTKKFENKLPSYHKRDKNLPLEDDVGRYKNDSNAASKYRKIDDLSRYR